jgi:aspartyl-tRNA(Asn)/glutamyl-tRNA(Gln) amidotransferase subunit A
MTGLPDQTLNQTAQALRAGEISSRELTQAYLERIEAIEPHLNAFITLDPDDALAQAAEADELYAQRRKTRAELPPLLGVPIAIKDVLAVKGMRCTAGSKVLENFVPPYDATVVERLRQAGCTVLGKTNTDEFAMGSSTENSAYEPTHNPWDLARVPGGSSGGSAAAVAARLAPAALGTDTGGSVRQPAAFCGVTGLKPTYGRVSRYGLIAYGSSLDVAGVLGRSAADVATIFALISGYDPRDATSLDAPAPEIQLDGEASLQNVRVGVPEEYFIEGVQPQVETAVRGAIQAMASLGAQVEPIHLPHTQYAVPVYYLIAPAEASANLARYDGVRYGPRQNDDSLWNMFRQTRGELFGAEVKRRIMLGTFALSAGYQDAYYGKAQKVRTLIQADFETAFKSVDVIAAPVAPTTAFKINAHRGDPLSMYLEDIFTLPANLAGIPGIAFPVGFDSGGLPVGMQLLGQAFHENTLLQIAHSYQKTTGWHKRQPNNRYDD